MSKDVFAKKFGENRVPKFQIGDRIRIKSKTINAILLKNSSDANNGLFGIGDTGFVVGMYWNKSEYVYILELDNKFAQGYCVNLAEAAQSINTKCGWKVRESAIELCVQKYSDSVDFVKKKDTGQIYSILGAITVVNPLKYGITESDKLRVLSLNLLQVNVIVNDDRLMSVDMLDIATHNMKYPELSEMIKLKDVFVTINDEIIKLSRKQVINILEENKKGVI